MEKIQRMGNTTAKSLSSSYFMKKAKISQRIRTFPAYSILLHFYLIPRVDFSPNGATNRFGKTSIFRMLMAIVTLLFIFLVLVHDLLFFCMNKDFWVKYFANGSRIITLLLSIRNILIFWKNTASIFLFLWKSRHLHRYLVELNAVVEQIPMTKKAEKRQRVLFLLVYFCPFILMGFRVAVSIYMLIESKPNEIVPFGFTRAPLWAKVTFYHFVEILGGIICIAVYAQIAAFVGVLKLSCKFLNSRLTALNCRLRENKELPTSTFQSEIRSLRDYHECLIDLCNKHENLFSLQILVAILNNAFVVFSSLASFFTPRVTIEGVVVYLLSIVAFIYAILLLPIFHIQLSEESDKTIELFQDVVHKRSQTNSLNHHPMEEFILLTYFLQRAMTKPLVVTAGGFMELNRSFVTTIGAVLMGFTLFLMERVESQEAPVVPCFANASILQIPEWTAVPPLEPFN